MLTGIREKFLLFLYFISVILSLLLCYYSGIYFLHAKYWPSWFATNHQHIRSFSAEQAVQSIQHPDSKMSAESENNSTNSYRLFELLVMCAATFILLLSIIWLLANSKFKKNEIRQTYGRFEMPTAVICSLFAGICAVTEFHYSIDYSFLHSSEKWTFAGIIATALSCLHAAIAFALQ